VSEWLKKSDLHLVIPAEVVFLLSFISVITGVMNYSCPELFSLLQKNCHYIHEHRCELLNTTMYE